MEGHPIVSLEALRGTGGPLWGTASDDLNATLLSWGPGAGTPEHVNSERDVFVYVVEGSGTLRLDGVEHGLFAGDVAVIDKGRTRQITAGADGLRYLSVHRRRPGLSVSPAPPR